MVNKYESEIIELEKCIESAIEEQKELLNSNKKEDVQKYKNLNMVIESSYDNLWIYKQGYSPIEYAMEQERLEQEYWKNEEAKTHKITFENIVF
ncbi:hypothetical protein [Priestia megaterium]|uniref:hypothetical protein n=1 Tax=Priestia megaterium TaxID=1404 RepID=UPI002469510E|nr:hypothetical protein [Priestia megaterium]